MSTGSSSKVPNMTKKQAERIMEEEMILKEFWTVTDAVDNFSVVQDVLDILFNVIEGNNYTTKYSKGQHYTRIVVFCKVCNKELSSFDPFITHDKGKHHKKTVNMLLSRKISLEEIHINIEFRDTLLPLMTFDEGSLEDRIDVSKDPVVGVHYVYKEVCKDRFLFTCQLCAWDGHGFRISTDEMLAHVSSDFHILKFMDIVHGYRNCTMEEISYQIWTIIEQQGRINAKITELEYDENDAVRYGIDRATKKQTSLKGQLPEAKRHRPSSSIEEISVPQSSDKHCEAKIFTESISEFVDELRNCIEEEAEIKSLLQEIPPEKRSILSRTVKVLSSGMMHFFAYNKDEVFENLCKKFVDMVSKL